MKRTIRTLGWLFDAVPAAGGTSSDMSRTS
jgi:hypothetical protein